MASHMWGSHKGIWVLKAAIGYESLSSGDSSHVLCHVVVWRGGLLAPEPVLQGRCGRAAAAMGAQTQGH